MQIHDQSQSEFMFPSAQQLRPLAHCQKGVRTVASSCEPLAVDALFQTEPEMAAYIAAVSVTGSNEVSEYPPTWHQHQT